jgi:hypothetical protein
VSIHREVQALIELFNVEMSGRYREPAKENWKKRPKKGKKGR